MQQILKKLIIGAAWLFTQAFAAYLWLTPKPALHVRQQKLTPYSQLLTWQRARADSLQAIYQNRKDELQYYLRVHHVNDEGYDMIADYNARNDSAIARLMSLRHIGLQRVRPSFRESLPLIIDRGYWDRKGWHQGLPPFHHGIITSMHAVYIGMVDKYLQPHGHGTCLQPGGSYYEGEWHQGLQHGFGFHLQPHKDIQVGTWLNGHYKGERLSFTSERIFGIDISRYQHERGRRRFGINWKNLCIVHLGLHNQKNVIGDTDYPVSFIYIKATQGTTVTSRYFAADYRQARTHGYHVGAYHFYSTTSGASEQAEHFLKVARFSSGDFPPVLDVEPSDAEIEAMGGAERLLSEMRTWLRIVEQRVSVKPILYVNQSFVNRYLQDAPDLKRGYLIWIARYSEYMPDIRLCWWQLSATGKVHGIEGDVDLNVFNGYGDQWEEFLATGLIP